MLGACGWGIEDYNFFKDFIERILMRLVIGFVIMLVAKFYDNMII